MKTDINKLKGLVKYLQDNVYELCQVESYVYELVELARNAAEDLEVAQAMISDLREEAHGLRPLTWKEVSAEELIEILVADYTLTQICSTDERDVMLHILRKGLLWPGYGGIKYIIRMARDRKSQQEVVN